MHALVKLGESPALPGLLLKIGGGKSSDDQINVNGLGAGLLTGWALGRCALLFHPAMNRNIRGVCKKNLVDIAIPLNSLGLVISYRNQT